MLATIVLVLGGNVCTFIIALMDSAYVVGRSITKQSSEMTRDIINKHKGTRTVYKW